MLQKFSHLNLQSNNIPALKSALMKIWNDLPQGANGKSKNRLRACVNADGGHFEHLL